ncbi:hypothetical protein R1sor_022687 [Riccia sorocarpa]|uniref:Uncharacterized protein n=1 Tax=Riccia sorocarpa TaxID=122646 RepID=A0ABD3GM39_9MARC
MENFIQSRLLEDRLERSRQEIERLLAEDQVHNVFLEQQFKIQLQCREQIQDLEIEQQMDLKIGRKNAVGVYEKIRNRVADQHQFASTTK